MSSMETCESFVIWSWSTDERVCFWANLLKPPWRLLMTYETVEHS